MNSNPWQNRVLLSVSLFLTLLLVILSIYFTKYGLDFSDEGSYLNAISHPFDYPVTTTQYGLIYHPLYLLVDGSIELLRQLNLLLLFSLGTWLAYIALPLILNRMVLSKVYHWGMSVAISGCTLVYPYALSTPSYNTLTLKGILLTSIGLLLAITQRDKTTVLPWLLIGLGGFLAFAGKPPSAILLAVTVLWVLWAFNLSQLKNIVVAVISSVILLILMAIALDGSVTGFVERLIAAGELRQYISSGHTLFESLLRFIHFDYQAAPELTMYITVGVLTAVLICLGLTKANSKLNGVVIILLMSLASFTAVMALQLISFWFSISLYNDYLLYIIPVAALAVVVSQHYGVRHSLILLLTWVLINIGIQEYLIFHRTLEDSLLPVILGLLILLYVSYIVIKMAATKDDYKLMLLFVLMPAAYSFGTNSNYYLHATQAGLFIALLSLLVLKYSQISDSLSSDSPLSSTTSHKVDLSLYLGLVIALQLILVISQVARLTQPFRQPTSFYEHQVQIQIGYPVSALYLDPTYAAYINDVRTLVNEAGFSPDTPIIDLTGRSPGLIYAIGGRSVGASWLVGGYIGSDKVAMAILERSACAIHSMAWIISEQEQVRHFPPRVLRSIKRNLEQDYQLVGRVQSPVGASNYPTVVTQYVYRPKPESGLPGHKCKP